MWPFKKKKATPEPTPTSSVAKCILCIPGNWKNFEDFNGSLIVSSGASYMVVGDMLINGKGQHHCTFEFCSRDNRMKNSFTYAGKVNSVSDEFLNEIDKHQYVIYITGETGSLKEAEHMAQAGAAILNAGGTGMKVESNGKAFTKEHWLDLLRNFEEHQLYEMFVLDSIMMEDGTVYSCGMQNLGLKDTIVSDEGFQDAVDLIRMFGYYQVVDKPVILNNQTFQKDLNSPVFRIVEELIPLYNNHKTFHNPYGMWRLIKLA